MEIRQLAERVLFSESLADKLATPTVLTDAAPGLALPEPLAPARPQALRFEVRGNRIAFPGPSAIRDNRTVGEALHYFANHELLAVELMALCLLKFPQAPAKFRMAVARTLLEEQEHVRLYRARMQACGVEFGEIPVGDYFWRVTAPMTDPSQFVARMSLTFEQANLDYSGFYAELFRRLGDAETAALMQRVYEDEIRHVRLGLHWFNRWRRPNESLFSSYAAALDRPLSPTRARGIGFNRAGREAAGLPKEFVDQLAVFGHSRGRSPDVFRFDPLAEERCRPGGARENKGVRAMAADLACLPAFLAAADDVVVVPKVPSVAVRSRWFEAGLPIPEFVEAGHDGGVAALRERKVRHYRPWAWSPAAPQLAAALGVAVGNEAAAFRTAADKGFHLQLRQQLATDVPHFTAGRVVADQSGLAAAIAEFADADIERTMVKPCYGAAGRDNRVVEIGAAVPKLKGAGPWVVEPWYEFLVTGSTQIEVEPERVRLLGDTVMATDDGGAYRGTITGNLAEAMPLAARMALYGADQGLRRVHEAARLAGRALQELGYAGPAGIDWGVLRTPQNAAVVHPLIELNPRYTMGRVALALQKRTLAGRTGMLALVNREQGLELALGAMAVENRTGKPLMAGGVLPLTDPETAQRLAAVWLVGESVAACRGQLPAGK